MLPKKNCDRRHTDYATPFQDNFFLVIVDHQNKGGSKLIEILADPESIVSYNASIFISDEFNSYCAKNRIFQKSMALEHPATNGLAERNVLTLKTGLKTMTDKPISMHAKVKKVIFRYRASPLANDKRPAEMYLQRNI